MILQLQLSRGVYAALKAAELLKANISAEVIDLRTLRLRY